MPSVSPHSKHASRHAVGGRNEPSYLLEPRQMFGKGGSVMIVSSQTGSNAYSESGEGWGQGGVSDEAVFSSG